MVPEHKIAALCAKRLSIKVIDGLGSLTSIVFILLTVTTQFLAQELNVERIWKNYEFSAKRAGSYQAMNDGLHYVEMSQNGDIVSGLIGGLPITQVIVRSSANIQSGGKTKISAIVHGLFILGFIALLPGVLNLIPRASLAAILLIVGYKLANPATFRAMWNKGKPMIPDLYKFVTIFTYYQYQDFCVFWTFCGVFVWLGNSFVYRKCFCLIISHPKSNEHVRI